MPWLVLEHSRTAYWLDFALYAGAITAMALALLIAGPAGHGVALAAWALAGAAGWTLAEYLLHRFVLHGLPPFKQWHAAHHHRPNALISTPTWLSALLFAGLALPACALLGPWPACALGLGLLGGYLAYGLAHHATHHPVPWRLGRLAWLARRRRWHAQHHAKAAGGSAAAGHFGVSSGLWDHVFRTHRPWPAGRPVGWRTDGPRAGSQHRVHGDPVSHHSPQSPKATT